MPVTIRLNITELIVGQSGGEILFNEAMNKMDAIIFPTIKDRDLTAPPGSEVDGDTYIPAATATGAWAGKEDNIAIFDNGYKFVAPDEGMVLYVDDEKVLIEYDGTNWIFQRPTKLNILVKTSGYTVLVADNGKMLTNTGASGTIIFTLPVAVIGLHYYFSVGAAQILNINPNGSETISLPSTGIPLASGISLEANSIGESIHIGCAVAGNWITLGGNTPTGIWIAGT